MEITSDKILGNYLNRLHCFIVLLYSRVSVYNSMQARIHCFSLFLLSNFIISSLPCSSNHITSTACSHLIMVSCLFVPSTAYYLKLVFERQDLQRKSFLASGDGSVGQEELFNTISLAHNKAVT